MAEGFLAQARRSSSRIGCISSSVAFPEVDAGNHMGSIGEGERAPFQLEVTAGDLHDTSDTSLGVACVGCVCGTLGLLGTKGRAASRLVPSVACDTRGAGGGQRGY